MTWAMTWLWEFSSFWELWRVFGGRKADLGLAFFILVLGAYVEP